MKLVDMKRSEKERKKANTASPCVGMDDKYGYGMRLRLGKEEIDKLGLKMPDVGAKFRIEAVGTVVEVTANSSSSYNQKSIEFQLRKIGIEKGGSREMVDAVKDGLDE